MSPVRVLIVAPSMGVIGGQSINADRLRRKLPEVSDLDIGFLPVDPALPGPLRLLQRVKYLRTIVTSIAYGVSLLRAVPQCDIVHAFSASYWSFLLAPLPAMLVGRLFSKRIILNYRSGEADDHLANWRTARWGARLADVIVAPSDYLVDVFHRHGFTARTIANFVDEGQLCFRDRVTPEPRFIANRHFEPLYNVPCVVRAFGRVQQREPQAELVLVGDGSQRLTLERLVTELGLKNVRFTGRVTPGEMPALYNAADIYLNAPDIDNMPGSILECFAAGLPVASTDAGGIPYIVANEETGLLVPCGDDAALAAAALRLLHERGLAHRLTTAARLEVHRRYTWPAVRDAWANLYRELGPRK